MLYIKCREKTKSLDPKISETKSNRLIMQSKCSVSSKNKKQKSY